MRRLILLPGEPPIVDDCETPFEVVKANLRAWLAWARGPELAGHVFRRFTLCESLEEAQAIITEAGDESALVSELLPLLSV